MQQVLFARQPIFDKALSVYAYELLFRNGEVDNARFVDGDLATRSVLLNAYAQNSAPQLLNGKPGFLNVSRFMLNNLPEFAKEFLYVEILEHEHHEKTLVSELKRIRSQGFKVALDDFDMAYFSPELIEQSDIVKLDVLAMTRSELSDAVTTLQTYDVMLLAEKVETQAMYQYCRELGFDLFQGYFFCRPELVRGRVIQSNRRALFDLLKEIYHPDENISRISSIVKRDAVLSYKLLKLANSSFYRRAADISSIDHAVMLLGLIRIRSWATLVCLGDLGDKPFELQTESFMRATMCEQLVGASDVDMAAQAFSAGMLSSIDAWFDQPMSELLDNLPLSSSLKEAILFKKGRIGEVLALTLDYLRTEWTAITEERLAAMDITHSKLLAAYECSVQRTDELATLMLEER